MADNVDTLDPNFKSTLPPRKRAKTKEEKEQRRVERILRNRRAAHASREKKRKHVEYLESYVVKLEENLSKLQGNFDEVSQHISKDKFESLDFNKLVDLSDLKEKIHSNLNSTVPGTDGDSFESPPKKRKMSECTDLGETPSKTSKSSDVSDEDISYREEASAKEESESKDLLSVMNDNVYFNYLSPISINSPVNSPIDLTLKKSDSEVTPMSLNDTSLSEPTSPEESNVLEGKEYDGMGQNSEEVLLPKDYAVGASPIISY